MSADLHCHTRLSDGSLGIEELILLAQRSGIDTIAITDHDCLAGTVRGKIIGERHGVNVIPGVELSAYDTEHDKRVHILCYLAENPDRLEGLCKKTSLSRRKASQLMMVKTAQRYPIWSDLVIKCAAGSTNIYKQHIMHALMECGYTTSIFGDLYDELFSSKSPDNILVTPSFPTPIEVLDAIHEAGGIAILAHPGFYDNFDIIDELIEHELDGIEVWQQSHLIKVLCRPIAVSGSGNVLTPQEGLLRGVFASETLHTGYVLDGKDFVPAAEKGCFLSPFRAYLRAYAE